MCFMSVEILNLNCGSCRVWLLPIFGFLHYKTYGWATADSSTCHCLMVDTCCKGPVPKTTVVRIPPKLKYYNQAVNLCTNITSKSNIEIIPSVDIYQSLEILKIISDP